ncbi:hypothetical protein FE257_011628 [Aspergillus nanangensis]|uniref:Uncharacterized protein n=1 Tax=Aspergillus nanangensis TaxID=2582783 RepID=A0AAD4CV03_ASPNN|nr:hypothetical protein FE257_011628 [Aspergillus nanangensis]
MEYDNTQHTPRKKPKLEHHGGVLSGDDLYNEALVSAWDQAPTNPDCFNLENFIQCPPHLGDETLSVNNTFASSSSSTFTAENDEIATALPVVIDSLSGHRDGDMVEVLYSPSSASLINAETKATIGHVTNRDTLRLFSGLLDDPGTLLQLYVLVKIHSTGYRKSSKQSSMNMIVYGPMELFQDVGEFFQDNECYLQGPQGCDRNVRYRNPHCISGLDPDPSWTFDLDLEPETFEEIVTPSNVLAGLETRESLTEAEDPDGIKTPLYPHQKQALSFLQRRERGWMLHAPDKDVWAREESASGKMRYVNNITNDNQRNTPPDFRGGILADDMGLGKTLTMIALIASDRANMLSSGPERCIARSSTLEPTKATLLIVPSSLLQEWQTQLRQHLANNEAHHVPWTMHHGQDKLYHPSQIHNHRVILTSYQTLASEYRAHSRKGPSILFRVIWHRIILDEAHSIRNRAALRTQAVLHLEGSCRWAVTGTPVQNSLSDFASLVEFLRVYPYCSRKAFKQDIIDVWKHEDEKVALERVTRLFKFISIRRTMSILNLPEKTDLTRYLRFSHTEMETYRGLESPIVQMIEKELKSERPDSRQCVHALLRINKLRKFCNLGVLTPNSRTASAANCATAYDTNIWNPNSARIILEDLMSSGQVTCSICDSDIKWNSDSNILLDECPTGAHMTPCLRLVCNVCYDPWTVPERFKSEFCASHQPCSLVPVSLCASDGANNSINTIGMGTSTKVLSLKQELERYKTEKCVVFSSWTTTLDMISNMLERSGIQYARIDGNVPAKNRVRALGTFQHDRFCQAILISISCGAEGLNLTSASRVYLMEPQWNPNLEAQALARVYRLGQTKRVTTTRFIIKDSIEEHVINVQDQKKHLGTLLLSQHKASNVNTRIRLQHLRRLLQ